MAPCQQRYCQRESDTKEVVQAMQDARASETPSSGTEDADDQPNERGHSARTACILRRTMIRKLSLAIRKPLSDLRTAARPDDFEWL